VSGSNDKKQPLTRADIKRDHLASQHRILNVLIVITAIFAVYLAINTIF